MAIEALNDRTRRLTNPEANKVRAQDHAVHDWYRFVLSFPPHLVRDCFRQLGIEPGQRVLDPFAGTGTTLVEAKRAGLGSVGLEGHPLGHFACSVKTDWTLDPDELVNDAERIADAAARMLRLKRSAKGTRNAADEAVVTRNGLRTLAPEAEQLILANSISPLPLHKVLMLREALDRIASRDTGNHLRLALATTMVADASNLHFGPEVGLGEIREDAPVIESWLNRVHSMGDDLRSVSRFATPAEAHRQDARDAHHAVATNSVDVVITSPPYPNEKDYTRTTRLESVLLGFIRTKHDLRALKQGLIRSNTRNIYVADDDERWVARFESIQKIAGQIEERRLALGKTSGFERLYHKVTKHYFGGMARHFANLRRVLRPGARLAYVVGDQASYLRVMIRTGTLLAEIAEDLGYEVEAIDLFRTRIATATGAALREEVVRLRWPG
jgi:DNA modification methylase